MSILDDNILTGLARRLKIMKSITLKLRAKVTKTDKENKNNKQDITAIKERLAALESAEES